MLTNSVTRYSADRCLKYTRSKNKSNLLSFLYADWCEKLPLELKDGEAITLASQDGSAVKVTNMLNGKDILLSSDHEEAD